MFSLNLILVLVEDGLRGDIINNIQQPSVLILVLVEDGLRGFLPYLCRSTQKRVS